MTGVGEGNGVGVGEADGVGVGVAEGVGVADGVGAGEGDGVGVGDAVGLGLGVGVGLELALLPALVALEELPPPHPTATNNMHARTAVARYLNIRAALLSSSGFRVRELEMQQSSCRMFGDAEFQAQPFSLGVSPAFGQCFVLAVDLLKCQVLIAKGWAFRGGRWYTAQCTISPLTYGF